MMDMDPLKVNKLNPLDIGILNISLPSRNRSGRPTKGDIIQFGPQPQSYISKLLQKQSELSKIEMPMKTSFISQDFVLSDNEDSFLDANRCSTTYNISEIALETKIKLGQKQFMCNFPNCNYSCKLSCNLIKHKRTHSQEKPYLCDMCSFQTKFVNSLKVHRRIHANERPFKCTFCSYSCNSSSNLKKHCKHKHSHKSLQS